jgi:hypothetical protein
MLLLLCLPVPIRGFYLDLHEAYGLEQLRSTQLEVLYMVDNKKGSAERPPRDHMPRSPGSPAVRFGHRTRPIATLGLPFPAKEQNERKTQLQVG